MMVNKVININMLEKKRFITDNPKELSECIHEYQAKLTYLIFVGEIDRNNVVFSNIGYGE